MLESGTRFERAASWESAEVKRTSHNTCALQVAMADWRPADYLHEDISEKSSDSSLEDESQEESESEEDSDESRSEESSDSI